jgi:preprotein translocase subunit SecG
VILAFWSWLAGPLNALVLVLGFILIVLVLIQRGKGGGLAGAFGGAGGSSAFGTRAGDLFTRITIGVATVWILLTMLQVMAVQSEIRQSPEENTSNLGSQLP